MGVTGGGSYWGHLLVTPVDHSGRGVGWFGKGRNIVIKFILTASFREVVLSMLH